MVSFNSGGRVVFALCRLVQTFSDGKWMDEEGAPYIKHLQDTETFPEDDEKLVLSNVTLDNTGWYSWQVK